LGEVICPLARVLSACFPTFDWGVYKDKKPRAIRKITPPREEVKRGRFLVKKKVGKFILKQKKTRFVIKKTEHNQLFV
jgi:hypothetical protein